MPIIINNLNNHRCLINNFSILRMNSKICSLCNSLKRNTIKNIIENKELIIEIYFIIKYF